MQVAHSSLEAWDNFYVIVGSSAAALTGLQFVVITLINERRAASSNTIGAFSTPTIVHFCAALLVSATISAPWPGLFAASFLIATSGVVGVLYTSRVVWRARRQTGYKMVAEDWTWHAVLPLASYIAMVAAGVLLAQYSMVSLFAIAGATLLLVFVGIHNAWDATTYVVTQVNKRTEDDGTTTAPARPTDAPAQPPATASENR